MPWLHLAQISVTPARFLLRCSYHKPSDNARDGKSLFLPQYSCAMLRALSPSFMAESSSSPRRGILHSAAGPFLWALLFAAIFIATFYLQKPSALVINNTTIREIFGAYGAAAGPLLALIGMFLAYILAGIKRVIGLKKIRILNPLIVLAVSLSGLAFGWQIAYREKPYTDIARAIIGGLGMPLLIAAAVTSALALLWFLLTLIRR